MFYIYLILNDILLCQHVVCNAFCFSPVNINLYISPFRCQINKYIFLLCRAFWWQLLTMAILKRLDGFGQNISLSSFRKTILVKDLSLWFSSILQFSRLSRTQQSKYVHVEVSCKVATLTASFPLGTCAIDLQCFEFYKKKTCNSKHCCLLNHIKHCYLIHYWFNFLFSQNKIDKALKTFKTYLDTKGASLSHISDFVPFFALPYVPAMSLRTHPSFSVLFKVICLF